MKVERIKHDARLLVGYDDLEQGHLYIDASDPADLDVYLALDAGVASLETGYYYPAQDEYEFPLFARFYEVGGKVVIEK